MAVGKLGALAPHPEHTHPRVKLGNHMSLSALPPTPAVVDYASKVRSWPMYMNDQIGDCTAAGIAHSVQAWSAYAKGLVTLPNSAVLSLYEAMGYVPGDPATDNGAVEQDVLHYVMNNGVAGHKILAYAQVDHTNPDEMKTALNLFGSLYLGANMPQSAMQQTDAGQPWSVVPGSPIDGGHCFVAQRWDTAAAPMQVVTWGRLQRATIDWWLANGVEAWVMISQDWFLDSGQSVTGVELPELGDEFAVVTGAMNPFRQAAKKKWYCTGLMDKIMPLLDHGKHSG
jgi:hypothetical protein